MKWHVRARAEGASIGARQRAHKPAHAHEAERRALSSGLPAARAQTDRREANPANPRQERAQPGAEAVEQDWQPASRRMDQWRSSPNPNPGAGMSEGSAAYLSGLAVALLFGVLLGARSFRGVCLRVVGLWPSRDKEKDERPSALPRSHSFTRSPSLSRRGSGLALS